MYVRVSHNIYGPSTHQHNLPLCMFIIHKRVHVNSVSHTEILNFPFKLPSNQT